MSIGRTAPSLESLEVLNIGIFQELIIPAL